jgi:hypothetical protein
MIASSKVISPFVGQLAGTSAKETSNDPIKSNQSQSNQLEMQAKVQGSQERKRGGGSCGDGNVYGGEKLYCAVHGGEN